jgi:hypothetical protein
VHEAGSLFWGSVLGAGQRWDVYGRQCSGRFSGGEGRAQSGGERGVAARGVSRSRGAKADSNALGKRAHRARRRKARLSGAGGRVAVRGRHAKMRAGVSFHRRKGADGPPSTGLRRVDSSGGAVRSVTEGDSTWSDRFSTLAVLYNDCNVLNTVTSVTGTNVNVTSTAPDFPLLLAMHNVGYY